MRAIHFPECNIELGKPADMTDEQCYSIEAYTDVFVDSDESGNLIERRFFLTAWVPNKEDLEALNAGRPIYIRFLSNGFPPTAVFTIDENGQPND